MVARDDAAIRSLLEESMAKKERQARWYDTFSAHVELTLRKHPRYVTFIAKKGSQTIGASTLYLSENGTGASLFHSLVLEHAKHAGISRQFVLARLVFATTY